MEYNDFLRLYYTIMIEKMKDFEFKPTIKYTCESSQRNPEFYEKKDCGWFGSVGIKLGAPNEEYEYFLGINALQYPEFIFFIPENELQEKSQVFNSKEEIEAFFDEVIKMYLQWGLIAQKNTLEA